MISVLVSTKTYVMGTHLKCLGEALLMSTTIYISRKKSLLSRLEKASYLELSQLLTLIIPRGANSFLLE